MVLSLLSKGVLALVLVLVLALIQVVLARKTRCMFRDIIVVLFFCAAVGIVIVVIGDFMVAGEGEIDTKEGTAINADAVVIVIDIIVAVNNSATDNICIRDTSSSSCFLIIVIVVVVVILFAVVASIL